MTSKAGDGKEHGPAHKPPGHPSGDGACKTHSRRSSQVLRHPSPTKPVHAEGGHARPFGERLRLSQSKSHLQLPCFDDEGGGSPLNPWLPPLGDLALKRRFAGGQQRGDRGHRPHSIHTSSFELEVDHQHGKEGGSGSPETRSPHLGTPCSKPSSGMCTVASSQCLTSPQSGSSPRPTTPGCMAQHRGQASPEALPTWQTEDIPFWDVTLAGSDEPNANVGWAVMSLKGQSSSSTRRLRTKERSGQHRPATEGTKERSAHRSSPTSPEARKDTASPTSPLSPSKERLQHNLSSREAWRRPSSTVAHEPDGRAETPQLCSRLLPLGSGFSMTSPPKLASSHSAPLHGPNHFANEASQQQMSCRSRMNAALWRPLDRQPTSLPAPASAAPHAPTAPPTPTRCTPRSSTASLKKIPASPAPAGAAPHAVTAPATPTRCTPRGSNASLKKIPTSPAPARPASPASPAMPCSSSPTRCSPRPHAASASSLPKALSSCASPLASSPTPSSVRVVCKADSDELNHEQDSWASSRRVGWAIPRMHHPRRVLPPQSPQQEPQQELRGPEREIRLLNKEEKIFDLYLWDDVLQEAGDGGKVVVCKPKNCPEEKFNYVMKIRSKESLRKQQHEDEFRKSQTRVLNLPPHVGVMTLREVLEDEKFYYIVMDRATGGSFFASLSHEFQDGVMPQHAVKGVMREILEAVRHLHKHRMLHRDIKPDNLVMQLIDNPGRTGKVRRVMLIDFDHADPDWSPQLQSGDHCVYGTLRFNAPESFLGQYSATSDLYSVGAILYLLMTGKMPHDDRLFEGSAEVAEDDREPGRPCRKSDDWLQMLYVALQEHTIDWHCDPWPHMPECRDFCAALLAFDPLERLPSAHEALRHRWLAS